MSFLRLSLKFNNNNKKNKTVPKTNVIDPTNNSTENKSPNDILLTFHIYSILTCLFLGS